MASADMIKLGCVACGGISHAHGIAAQENADRARFVACCDVVADRAKAWAEKYGCEHWYTDYKEMLTKEDLDAVVLATWPGQHRQQIERCLKAGIRNILCEKSLTITGREAMEIFDLAAEYRAFVMEGFMYRHHPAIIKLQKLIADGEIGEVDTVRACFSEVDPETADPADPNRNWRYKKELAGGTPYDFACYCVNTCRLFAGGVPKRVVCYGGISAKYDVINRMYGLIEYDNGRIGIIESSKTQAFLQDLQISGTTATLNLPIAYTILGEITIERHHTVGWADVRRDLYHIGPCNSFVPQMTNFADVIQGRAKPGMPLAESVVNIFTVEALVASLTEKRGVTVEIPDRIRSALGGLSA